MKHREQLQRIIQHYGKENQMLKAVEESTELSLALQHHWSGKAGKSEVITEIADMMILCNQMALLFGESEVELEIDRKIKRTIKRMN
jgi:phosphoribosyl-ATP pyrophosphohydrolase